MSEYRAVIEYVPDNAADEVPWRVSVERRSDSESWLTLRTDYVPSKATAIEYAKGVKEFHERVAPQDETITL